jgi:hypothetical protein
MLNIRLVEGRLHIKDQIREYIDCGNALASWSYLDYFLGTYDGRSLPERTSDRGRPASHRVPYLESSGHMNHCRIVKAANHETMPYFPGQWFPKRDAMDTSGQFEACMLALLKPWRSITDIKGMHETFNDTYNSFLSSTPDHIQTTIDNIQFFHECAEKATTRQSTNEDFIEVERADTDSVDDAQEPGEDIGESEPYDPLISEEDIIRALNRPFSARELLYADTAVDIGRSSGALPECTSHIPFKKPADRASTDQQNIFHSWENTLHTVNQEDTVVDDVDFNTEPGTTHATSQHIDEPSVVPIPPDESVPSLSPQPTLNTRQRMVHNIITAHLQAYLRGENPPQRLMIVHGQGGTGKSALLNAISKTFADLGAAPLLAKTAMSGVAASIIGGQTLHSWASLPIVTPTTDRWLTRPGKEVEKRRKANMDNVLWLTVDEKSMMMSTLLLYLSQATGIIRSALGSIEPSSPFGGLSLVLLGDFHQFPPVANPHKALYNSSPASPPTLSDDARLGRSLYEQFNMVVKLEEQMRIRDPTWKDILQRSQTGNCTKDDIDKIQKLVLSHPACTIPNFTVPPWDEAVLITPCNGTHALWNEDMLSWYCRRTGEVCYTLYAHDTSKCQPLSRQQRLTIAHMKLEKTAHLPNKVELAIGMKTMVLSNIAPSIDLANGSRGIITDIILDPQECALPNSSNTVFLQYPPAAVIFRPYNASKIQLPGLPSGVVPIFPMRSTFCVGGTGGITVHREQMPITAAYAFTDYKAQGQTMECVLVDLSKPPTGALNRFNAYIALSRGRGRNTIRLLREVDTKLFTEHPSEILHEEDVRLSRLEMQTLECYEFGEFGNFSP